MLIPSQSRRCPSSWMTKSRTIILATLGACAHWTQWQDHVPGTQWRLPILAIPLQRTRHVSQCFVFTWQGLCKRCLQPVPNSQAVLQLSGLYHAICLQCSHCLKPLQPAAFLEVAGLLLCQLCYNKTMLANDQCALCGRLTPLEDMMDMSGKLFCRACFVVRDLETRASAHSGPSSMQSVMTSPQLPDQSFRSVPPQHQPAPDFAMPTAEHTPFDEPPPTPLHAHGVPVMPGSHGHGQHGHGQHGHGQHGHGQHGHGHGHDRLKLCSGEHAQLSQMSHDVWVVDDAQDEHCPSPTGPRLVDERPYDMHPGSGKHPPTTQTRMVDGWSYKRSKLNPLGETGFKFMPPKMN